MSISSRFIRRPNTVIASQAFWEAAITMTKRSLYLSLLIASCLASGSAWARPVPVSSWQFNGTLGNDIAGGDPLTVNGAQAVTFATSAIGGVTAHVAGVPAFSNDLNHMSAVNPIGANGGGARTNDYTLIMDVNFPTFPGLGAYASLLETNPANNDDVDFFVRNTGVVDLESPQIAAGITANTWYRMAIRSERVGGSLLTELFLDGQFIGGGSNGIDGGATLTTPFLLFSDNDGNTAPTLVNSIALYDGPLSNSELAELGAATAAGIPYTAAAATLVNSEFVASGSAVLENGSGTLRIEDSRLGGHSTPMFVPEPGALLQLGSGAGLLSLLVGRRRRSVSHTGRSTRLQRIATRSNNMIKRMTS